jgi:lipopolysaccharide transport system ATP-binding protein
MSNLAIRAQNISKLYKIGARRNRHDTLRDHLVHSVKSLFSRNGHRSAERDSLTAGPSSAANGHAPKDHIWALKDISFEIKHGEAVAFIGRNGAGKSTLLKILSRITEPTTGRVEIYGRVGSLLEVGTGFHPELTGRENIFLNGAILGMKKVEIGRKFDEIVAFSEVEQFIDTPVKRYSSGMRVRLAFSVAAHLEPEILIVDEVLAVGDTSFQKKCLGKMDSVAKEGRTVLFVSHNMAALQTLCQRGLWLNNGCLKVDGSADSAVEAYFEQLQARDGSESLLESTHRDLTIEKVILKDGDGVSGSTFKPNEAITVEFYYHAKRSIEKPHFYVGIANKTTVPLFCASMLMDGVRPERLEGRGKVKCTFWQLPLLPQNSYVVRLSAQYKDGAPLIQPSTVGQFRVIGSARDIGFVGETADSRLDTFPPVMVPYTWELADGRVAHINPLVKGYNDKAI